MISKDMFVHYSQDQGTGNGTSSSSTTETTSTTSTSQGPVLQNEEKNLGKGPILGGGSDSTITNVNSVTKK